MQFSDGRSILVDNAFFCPGANGARRTLLPESWLLKRYGIEVLKKDMILKWPDGHGTPIYEDNELYFIDASFCYPSAVPPPRHEANLAVRADELAMLWAARMGIDASKLIKLSNAVHGINIRNIAKSTAELINLDRFRRFACSKKQPTPAQPVTSKAQRAGEGFHCDTTGKHAAKSVADGAHFALHAVCEYTDFGYIATSSNHTVDTWVAFIRHVVLHARTLGHNPKWVRFDQAPELRSDELKERIESELGILVQLAPRTHPQSIHAAERTQGQLYLMAEADLQRAEKGPAWLLPGVVYAQYKRNRKAAVPHKETRYQRYIGQSPSFEGHLKPLLFGTRVIVHEDKSARGVKGSLDKPRASNGTFIGIEDGTSHNLVIKDGGGLIKPKHVDPLDEMQLLRRGRASSATLTEAGTQTDTTHACQLAPQPVPSQAKQLAPLIVLDVGERVAVQWTPHGGGPKQEYLGSITAIEGTQRARLWTVQYDGWDALFKHNFDTTKRQWRRLDVVPSDKTEPPVTRASARLQLMAASASIEALLEHTPADEQIEVFNAATHQLLGDFAARYECSSASDLERKRLNILTDAHGIKGGDIRPTFECSKAAQNVVDISTDIGTTQMRVPANKREVESSPERDKWLEADRKAIAAILVNGNRLVPEKVALDKNAPIMRCVTARKLKIDQATGRLADHNPFKSRHAGDGAHLEMLRAMNAAKAGESVDYHVATSSVADDMAVKLFLADASVRDRNLLKADISDAYVKGKRLERPIGYMAMPNTCQEYDEDGSKLIIELVTPLWGEGPAGYEWQRQLNDTLRSIGWRQCEDVPAMFYHGDGGPNDARMLTIVDDILISEAAGYDIAEKTIAALRSCFGSVTSEREPTSFVGYKLQRDRAARTLTISMPQKIIEACGEHLPQIIDGKASVLSGKKLMDAADSLALDPRSPTTKLTPVQVKTQRIIGSLKFIERAMPKLSLILHRLSCVMSSPCPAALDVALAALSQAYADRNVGITFGGTGDDTARFEGRMQANLDLTTPAGASLEASADATWCNRSVYGMILTYARGAIFHHTKKIGMILDSSTEAESVATAKAGEQISYAREILRALGVMPDGPTPILTDNLANMLIARDATSAARARHFLRRYTVLQQRIAAGEVTIFKIDDPNMPADFLTKWIPARKLRDSVAYATNSRHRVA